MHALQQALIAAGMSTSRKRRKPTSYPLYVQGVGAVWRPMSWLGKRMYRNGNTYTFMRDGFTLGRAAPV